MEHTVLDWDDTPDHLMAMIDTLVTALMIDDHTAAHRTFRQLCATGANYRLSDDWMRGLVRLLRDCDLPHHAMLVEIHFPHIVAEE